MVIVIKNIAGIGWCKAVGGGLTLTFSNTHSHFIDFRLKWENVQLKD